MILRRSSMMNRSVKYGLVKQRNKLKRVWGCIVHDKIVQNLFYGRKRLQRNGMVQGNVEVVGNQSVYRVKALITPTLCTTRDKIELMLAVHSIKRFLRENEVLLIYNFSSWLMRINGNDVRDVES